MPHFRRHSSQLESKDHVISLWCTAKAGISGVEFAYFSAVSKNCSLIPDHLIPVPLLSLLFIPRPCSNYSLSFTFFTFTISSCAVSGAHSSSCYNFASQAGGLFSGSRVQTLVRLHSPDASFQRSQVRTRRQNIRLAPESGSLELLTSDLLLRSILERDISTSITAQASPNLVYSSLAISEINSFWKLTFGKAAFGYGLGRICDVHQLGRTSKLTPFTFESATALLTSKMPHITTAMEKSVRRGVGEAVMAKLRRRDIVGEVSNVKDSFSSWSKCMEASYCKFVSSSLVLVCC